MESGIHFVIGFKAKKEMERFETVFRSILNSKNDFRSERTAHIRELVLEWLNYIGEEYGNNYNRWVDSPDWTLDGLESVKVKKDKVLLNIVGGMQSMAFQKSFAKVLSKIDFITAIESTLESGDIEDVGVRAYMDKNRNIVIENYELFPGRKIPHAQIDRNILDKRLLESVEKGDLAEVKTCVLAGARANCINENQWSVFQIAVANKHVDIVKYFLMLGFSADQAFADGTPAIEWAKKHSTQEIYTLLREYNLN